MIHYKLYQYNPDNETRPYRIQGTGTIERTGQMFEFRYENGWAVFTIFKGLSRYEIDAEYREHIRSDKDRSDEMPLSIVIALLNRLVHAYLSGCDLRSKLATATN